MGWYWTEKTEKAGVTMGKEKKNIKKEYRRTNKVDIKLEEDIFCVLRSRRTTQPRY